ncbi:MAG: hypothetical protein RQ760_19660, partial [Sedimentisphaerales bacterium]|nr:hypothetical protein [Sedimentisphaerales bacterium]
TEKELRQAFTAFGEVTTINVITDKYDSRPKGFAFVEMAERDSAVAAISDLNGKEVNGRTLRVNEAKPKNDNGNRSGNNNYRRMY